MLQICVHVAIWQCDAAYELLCSAATVSLLFVCLFYIHLMTVSRMDVADLPGTRTGAQL